MLILARNVSENVIIYCEGREVKVTLTRAESGRARLGFTADPDVRIVRGELVGMPQQAPKQV